MTTERLLLAAGAAALAGFALYSHAAGPLTPPAPPGDPAADMPSLTELRSAAYQGRTPLAGSTSTVTISQPGNYVLTGNITVGEVNGILITADNVTLDLNGFTIATTSSNPGSHRGIFVQGKNIVIRNGRIKSNYLNDSATLTGGGFAGGVEGDFDTAGNGSNVICEDLQIIGCQNAITFYWPEGNYTVRRCTVHHGGGGITLGGGVSVVPSTLQNTVTDCQIVQCTNSGIRAGIVKNCYVFVNGSSPVAISAALAVGCTTMGGALNIANRYDMP